LTGSNDPNAEPVAWTVPPRDAKALAGAILDAIDSPEERRLRSERAYARVERLFTADRMVEATLGVYRELLNRHA
jgi:glycosyltransferase involved in cell wall biosynthesis